MRSQNTNKITFNINNSLSNEFSRITLFPHYRFQEIFLRKCAGMIRKFIFQICRKLYVCATFKSYNEHFKLVQSFIYISSGAWIYREHIFKTEVIY